MLLGGVLERRAGQGSVDGASASARATSPSVTTGTSADDLVAVSIATLLDASPVAAASSGFAGATTGGTSAGAGSSSGRCRPPVGSFGRRSWLGSSSKRLVTMIGIGDGRGSFSAARTRLRPNSEADERSAGSGRPARSQHRRQRAEVGRHRHQAADPRRQRRHRRSRHERHGAGDRFDEDQPQRVDVGVPVDRLPEGLLRRAVAGDVGRNRRGSFQSSAVSRRANPKSTIRSRRSSPKTSFDGSSSPCTRFLRWAKSSPCTPRGRRPGPARGELPAPVEQVAQAPAGEVLDHGVDRRALADLFFPPVVDGGEVGMRQLGHRPHRPDEAAPELLGLGDLRAHQLDGDGAVELEVIGVGDQGVGAGRDHPRHPVAPTQDSPGEAAPRPSVGRSTVMRAVGTCSSWAPKEATAGTFRDGATAPGRSTAMARRVERLAPGMMVSWL